MKMYVCVIVWFALLLQATATSMEAKEEKANEDHWMRQKLNHFDEFDRRTWLQRYLKADAYYKTGGPIFVFIGGESDSYHFYLQSNDLLMRATKDFGAMLFFLEHRYYGKSRPTKDTSVKNLRYLTTNLALADLAYFIQYLKTDSGIPPANVVVFGASYSGALAAWSRSKYPHLIYAAVAISPPLEAKLFFHEYMYSVNNTLYEYGGIRCHNAIARANEEAAKLMKTSAGRDELSKLFNLCEGSDLHGNSMELFHSILNNNIDDVIQYSKGNIRLEEPATIYMTIEEMCEMMSDDIAEPEILRFSRFIAKRENYTDCMDTNFSSKTRDERNTTWGPESGNRIWVYQTCTEFGWFQTILGAPFQNLSNDFPVNLCTEIFGPMLKANDVQTGPTKTNLNFGGLEIANSLTRTVVWNGGVDPWHRVSYWKPNVIIDKNVFRKPVISDISPISSNHKEHDDWWRISDFRDPHGFSTIFVPGASHCEALQAEREIDSVELKNARKAIIAILDFWLDD